MSSLSPDQLREALDAAFPRAWREVLERRVPFYRALSEDEQERLEDLIQHFVLTKTFVGRGLEVTDEMKVVVAAAACRLTLNLPWLEYANIGHVTLRAKAWSVRGVQVIGTCDRLGVELSWPSLVSGMEKADDGINVGYHEFAHALDAADGAFDGEAPRPPGGAFAPWAEVISLARKEVVDGVRSGLTSPIDAQAAKSDAELFAVATEWFFERPRDLSARFPAVYQLLRDFYRQDPAA